MMKPTLANTVKAGILDIITWVTVLSSIIAMSMLACGFLVWENPLDLIVRYDAALLFIMRLVFLLGILLSVFLNLGEYLKSK